MAGERPGGKEDDSVWKSKLFKWGVIGVVIFAAVGLWEAAAVGVVVAGAGGGWHVWKGKNK